MILIPVKDLSTAKQRLAHILDQPARTQLAQAMLLDVLEAVASWDDRPEVSLVSGDPYALALARRFRFQVIPDTLNPGETGAIEMATRLCEAQGAESTMVIPADVPLISSGELQQVFRAAPPQGSVLVPAADGRGTNAILRRPAGLFPLRFGNDSFRPHLAAAKVTGKPWVVLSLTGVGLDVDNPSDLKRLAETAGETRSQRLVREWGFHDIRLAVNR